MSLDDFQVIDIEIFDNSFLREFMKIYHQQGAILKKCDQNFEFIFGEKN